MKRYLWPLTCVLCLAAGYALAHLPALRYDVDANTRGTFRTDRVTGQVCRMRTIGEGDIYDRLGDIASQRRDRASYHWACTE